MIEADDDTAPATVSTFESAAAEFDDDIRFTYCTEFIVGRNAEIETEIGELRSYLESIGDCVVVVNDDEIIKVHVHRNSRVMLFQKDLSLVSFSRLRLRI